jgi:hypothetical protein
MHAINSLIDIADNAYRNLVQAYLYVLDDIDAPEAITFQQTDDWGVFVISLQGENSHIDLAAEVVDVVNGLELGTFEFEAGASLVPSVTFAAHNDEDEEHGKLTALLIHAFWSTHGPAIADAIWDFICEEAAAATRH